MKRALSAAAWGLLLALASAGAARATGPYAPAIRNCYNAIALQTINFARAVETEIRTSIRKNLNAASSPCSGPSVCVGGPKQGKACTSNATCGAANGVPFECHPKTSAGIAGAINGARATLRKQIATACPDGHLDALFGAFGGSARCPDPSATADGLTASELTDCIFRTEIGELGGRRLIGTVGERLGTSAPDAAVDTPIPKKICGVVLGGIDYLGSRNNPLVPTTTSTGTLKPALADGCSAGNPVCPTKGATIIGNLVEAPEQVMAAPSIPVCTTTRSLDAGNGTPEDGTIDLASGLQTSLSPVLLTIVIGEECPICDRLHKICTSPDHDSPHEGFPCTAAGETDIACPPKIVGSPPTIKLSMQLTTEALTLFPPTNDPAAGVDNEEGAFCGACADDPNVVCINDSECAAEGLCPPDSAGCCQFGQPGAFGDETLHGIAVEGTRGAFMPQLVGLACLGKTGDALVDAHAGLPGPFRTVQSRLNAFSY